MLKRQTAYSYKPFKFTADSDNPSVETLRGNIVIELEYNGQSWGRAETSELKLVCANGKWPWTIDAAEVDRTFKVLKKPN